MISNGWGRYLGGWAVRGNRSDRVTCTTFIWSFVGKRGSRTRPIRSLSSSWQALTPIWLSGPYLKVLERCDRGSIAPKCSPMIRETWVQSQVESYQKLLKWYLIPPWLTLSNIRYVSRVKWSNPGKEVAPYPTPRCSSYWKGSLRVTLDLGRQLYFLLYNYLTVRKKWFILNRIIIWKLLTMCKQMSTGSF